ncbi:MAG: T9SS type A sorting domain-containing protein, partial [Ignavibacteria bacterium]|nr:T9SS type A sorting domain-containing protein [Ignavibacteria bacterium]
GSNVFAGTEKNGFFMSSDNGVSWTNINRNLGTRISVSRMFISGNDLYGATYTSSIVKAPLSSFIGIHQLSTELPDNFSLKQNYPNPFNPSTTINFSLKASGIVSLKVYDMRGTEIAELVNQKMNAGTFSFTFDASNYNLSSGVYFYKLQANEFEDVKRMVLVK